MSGAGAALPPKPPGDEQSEGRSDGAPPEVEFSPDRQLEPLHSRRAPASPPHNCPLLELPALLVYAPLPPAPPPPAAITRGAHTPFCSRRMELAPPPLPQQG